MSNLKNTGKHKHQSEDAYRALVESTSDSLYLVDENCKYLFINSQHLSRLGVTTGNIIGRSYGEFHSPEETEYFTNTINEVLTSGKSVQHEHQSWKDNRYFLRTFSPVEDPNHEGKSTIVAVVSKDISGRKRAEEALRESERRYRRITEAITDYIYTVRIEDGKAIDTRHGPGCSAVTGYTEEEFAADPYLWINMVAAQDRKAVEGHAMRVLAGEETPPLEHRIIRKDGIERWVRNTPVPRRDEQGRLQAYDGLIQDITDRKRAEKALQESEELYRVLAEKSFAGVYVVQEGKFRFLNSNAASYFGYTQDELIGRESMKLVYPEDREQLKKNVIDMLHGERVFPYEFRIITREGQIKWLMEMVTSISWEGKRAVLGNSMDLTERKKTEEEIRSLSMTDQLTGLYNRRGFLTLAEQQLKISERHKRDLLLFFADLDGMKWINDTLGHEEGDAALRDISVILKETFRATDIVARIGGDEFAILAIDTTGVYPEVILARLQNEIDMHNKKDSKGYKVSISMGTAYYDPQNPCSLDELMSRADKLMYEQKRRKKPWYIST
ncbi:MAG TPA: PAS domain S-box protein [Syntrophales bacterium]|nr:PAS domain S-box protein [Syntrophales bacterium]